MFRAAMCQLSGKISVFATLGTYYSVWMTVWYTGSLHPVYVVHTEQQVPSVAKTQLFLLMMGT